MFKYRPNGKDMSYHPNGIQSKWKWHYDRYGKDMVYSEIVFRSDNRHGNRQKNTVIQYKRYNANENQFYTLNQLNEEDKSNVSSSFRGI